VPRTYIAILIVYHTTGMTHIKIIFLIMSRSFVLRMRNTSDENCKENQNPYFMSYNIFCLNRAVYEIKSKNMIDPDGPQMTIWRMRIEC